jgi:hypothetical protein
VQVPPLDHRPERLTNHPETTMTKNVKEPARQTWPGDPEDVNEIRRSRSRRTTTR